MELLIDIFACIIFELFIMLAVCAVVCFIEWKLDFLKFTFGTTFCFRAHVVFIIALFIFSRVLH